MWMSEALFEARVSPWLTLARRHGRRAARRARARRARLMRARLDGARAGTRVYRRKGRPCPRCGDADPLVAARRRDPHGVLVPGLPKRRGPPARGVTKPVAVRAPHLYRSLRGFALARSACSSTRTCRSRSRSTIARHGRRCTSTGRSCAGSSSRARPSSRSARTRALALEDLRREPAARIFARAHAGPRANEDEALFRTVVLPLLISTAEGCGGFDWDDAAFDRAYAELERSLFGKGHAYAAVAPLVGISVGTAIDLGDGLRVRNAATGELAAHWPEAQGLLPPDFGRETDRLRVLELEREPAQGRAGAARRARRARRRRHGAATRHRGAGRRGAGAVRAARLAPVRHPAGAADRRDAAGRRADAPGRVPRPARGRPARPAARGRRGPGARRGARPLGAVALPGRPVPRRAAARVAGVSLRRRRRRAGPRRCALRCCSARARRSAAGCSSGCRAARRRPTSSAARSSRSSCTATAPGCSRRSTSRSSGSRRRRRDISHFGQQADTRSRVPCGPMDEARAVDRAAEPDRGARSRGRARRDAARRSSASSSARPRPGCRSSTSPSAQSTRSNVARRRSSSRYSPCDLPLGRGRRRPPREGADGGDVAAARRRRGLEVASASTASASTRAGCRRRRTRTTAPRRSSSSSAAPGCRGRTGVCARCAPATRSSTSPTTRSTRCAEAPTAST